MPVLCHARAILPFPADKITLLFLCRSEHPIYLARSSIPAYNNQKNILPPLPGTSPHHHHSCRMWKYYKDITKSGEYQMPKCGGYMQTLYSLYGTKLSYLVHNEIYVTLNYHLRVSNWDILFSRYHRWFIRTSVTTAIHQCSAQKFVFKFGGSRVNIWRPLPLPRQWKWSSSSLQLAHFGRLC